MPGNRNGPTGSLLGPASGYSDDSESLARSTELRRLVARIDYAEPIRRRAVQEAISGALASTWTRRADMFDWARPRPGDFTGQAGQAQLAAADQRCAGVAQACRNHAQALTWGWLE